MNKLKLEKAGDEIEFWYEDSDEVLLFVNSEYPSVLFRDDIVELIGFLSQFVDGEV